MTPRKVADKILRELRNHQSYEEVDAIILAELNLAQVLLEGGPEYPGFLLNTETPEIFTVGGPGEVFSIELPEDFLAEAESHMPVWKASAEALGGLEMVKRSYAAVMRNMDYFAYCISGGRFVWRPSTPVGIIEFRYYQKAAEIESLEDAESGWYKNYPLLLMNKAGFEVAKVLGDSQALQTFSAGINSEYSKMIAREIVTAEELRGADR